MLKVFKWSCIGSISYMNHDDDVFHVCHSWSSSICAQPHHLPALSFAVCLGNLGIFSSVNQLHFSIYSKMQRKETETLLHETQTPYVHHVSTFSSGLRLFLLNLLPLQRFTDTERSYSNRLLLTQQRWVEVGINYHSCADFTEIWWKFELHLDGHQAGDALQKWVDITVSFR